MLKRLIFIASLTLGLTLFFSGCGGDDDEDPPSINIPLAFFSPMAAGDYTVRITITATDIPNQITSEQNLAIVEGANRTYDVTVDNIPVGSKRAVKVEVFKAAKRLFDGSGTVNISSGENQLALRLEKVAELLTSEPASGGQMFRTGVLTLNFSAPPGTVTVNGAKAVVQRNTASWTAPGLAAGVTNLNIAWTAAGGGSHTLPLIIIGSPAIVTITPSSVTLTAIGETMQLNATVKDAKDQTVPGATVTWQSNNPAVAEVNSSGLVTARTNGTATITATSGGKSTPATITVAQASSTIAIHPASATLVAIGETIQLSTTVKDAKDQIITGATVSWSSNNPAVAEVNTSGLVTARGNGPVTITATSGGQAATATITVAQASSTISIHPASATLTAIGETMQLSATVKDAKDQTVPGATVTWQSNNPAVAEVSSSGLVTARTNGTATIIATSAGKTTTAVILVTQSPATIIITPSSATLTAIGETVQLSTTVKDAKQQTVTGAIVSWSSNNPAVASVNSSGLVTAHQNGTTTITATSNSQTTAAIITVAQASSTIAIHSASATLTAIGETVQLSATVKDAKSQTVPGATISWSSNNPFVASISSTGLVTARGNGTVTITATSGGKSTTATITVAQSPNAIVVTPASANLNAIGSTVQLGATVRDANNNIFSGASISWSSNNPFVASISSTGLVTARGGGTATITATSGGRTATVTITVVQLPNTIIITPSSATLVAIGETVQLRATVKDEKAQTVPGASVTWQSSNPVVVSVNSSGLVTARGNGTATITATSGGRAATATITVARPDLIVLSPSATPNSVNIGQVFTLWVTVRNQGAGTADATTLRYYRSTDATISTSDTLVGMDNVSSIAAAHTNDHSINLTAPSSTGTYYYGACVVAVNGESNTNNNCSQGVKVTVTSRPTIEPVTIISSSPMTGDQMPQGGSITIIFSGLPGNVTVNGTQAVVQGATAIWHDPGLPVGRAILDVAWTAAGGGRSIIELTIIANLIATAAEGKISFVSNRDGDREIYVMDPDGLNQINLTNNPDWDEQPAWSPDSRRIAFMSNRDGNSEIYVMDANGGNQINLTNNSSEDYEPAWSPDGRKIAFVSNRDGDREIYMMDANGGNQINLTNNSNNDWDPAWSPDGRKIAFVSNRDTDWEIYVMDTNGRNQINLTNNSNTDSQPAWSPDGRKIALNRDAGGLIYAIDADGASPIRLTDNPRGDYDPAWSPDGRRITFMSNRDGNSEIYVMDANGGNQINLTNNPSEDYEPAWSRRH